MTPEKAILDALLTHLDAWAGDYPIVWGNTQYPPAGKPKADKYVVVSYSPGTPAQVAIDSMDENRHMGVLGISILSPLNGGEVDSQEIGGDLAQHFHGQVLSSGTAKVRITARPRVAGGYVDGDRWRTPVTVPFETVAV